MTEPADPKPVPWWHLHRRTYDWVLHWAHTPYGPVALGALAFAESSFFPIPPDVLLIALVLGHRKKAWRFATICAIASIVGGVFGYGIGTFAWDAGADDFFFNNVPGFHRDKVTLTDGTALTGLILSPKSHPVIAGDERDTTDGRRTPSRPVTADPPPALDFEHVNGDRAALPAGTIDAWRAGPYTNVRWAYDRWGFLVVFTAGFTPLPYKVITITAGVFKINFLVFLIASAISRSARFFLVAGLIWWAGPAMKRWIDRYFNWLTLAFVVLLVGGIAALKYL